VHGGESGYTTNGYAPDGLHVFAGRLSATKLFLDELNIERPIMDFLAAVMCDRLFERFPNVRMASIENGSGYLNSLCARLRRLGKKLPDHFAEDPVETFREHVWVSPFWEERIRDAVELLSADHVLFGSDWPHVEGLAAPLDYLVEVADFDEQDRELILRENTRSLSTRRPA
jgi:predicted TIM-barrel fold metal-dependent hydrolase